MLKWVSRFLLTLLLLLGIGSLGYLYVMSEGVVPPSTPTISIPSQLNSSVNVNRKEELKHLLAQKKISLEHQSRLLENKKELLLRRKKEIEGYITTESQKIRKKYQSEIDSYQGKLEEQYQDYIKVKEQEYKEQMIVKQELYTSKLEELVQNLEDSSLQQLSQYEQDLIKKYYAQKVNYDLKLKFLDLTNEEKQQYIDKLAELENEYLLSIENKESNITEEIQNKIEENKKVYNNELDDFENSLVKKIDKQISQKRSEIDEILNGYLVQQQGLMEAEINKRTEEIRKRSEEELSSIESLIKEISQEYFSVQSEVSILEKEVIY